LANPAIIVHGGAGNWPKNKHAIGLAGVRKAATRGFQILLQGRSAIKAVESAVIEMEDNPIFNAGKGSTLNLAGNVEADAGIMDGKTLRGAGVALLHNVKNPISLAKLVMEKTDHALLAGKNAERLGEAYGLPVANLRIPERVRQWSGQNTSWKSGISATFPET
jgi:L-asparaginase / beta-aspartyl-peptidase